MSVYPNPAKDVLHIEYLVESEGMFEAQLVNLHGVILTPAVNAGSKAGLNKVTMNLVDVPNGLYLLKSVYGDQQMTLKVVVNR